jgi:hypothetical protein
MSEWEPKRRIILHPGEVFSEHDRQRHFIDAPRLARLYGVRLEDCLVQDYRNPESYRGFYARKNDMHLYPRKDGSYPRLTLI